MYQPNILIYFFLLLLSKFYLCGKIKMVDEPFSFTGAQVHGGAARGTDNQEAQLLLKYHPGKPSGPPYLIENLSGKCFTLLSGNYKYDFCPFHNITQREQAYRWNAFNGILGIWKEWTIDGDNFTSMHYVHGDACAGNLERETNVKLMCGKENLIVSVSEPSMCRYEMLFRTPYVCPEDVFFVHPMLSLEGRQKWQEIENDHALGITTEKGYKNRRKKLFISEGLSVPGDLFRKTGATVDFSPNVGHPNRPWENLPATAASSETSFNIPRITNNFDTLHHCNAEYTKLKEEVERLREQLRSATLMNIQSVVSGTSVDTTMKPIEKVIDNSNLIIESDSNIKINNDQPTVNKQLNRQRGDPGVHQKDIAETVKPHLRKLVDSNQVVKLVGSNVKNNKLQKRRRGDEGILEEENFPLRNLMGRIEYQSNVISRLKVHSRLRDGRSKLTR